MTEIAGVAAGAVRVLGPQIPRAEEIETIPAAFEMDEILYELREHASGLNAGRWDYLFSVIKHFRDAGPDFVLPDRGSVRSGRPATGSTGPGSPTRPGQGQEVLDRFLADRPNQLDRKRDDVTVTASQLLDIASVPGPPATASMSTSPSVEVTPRPAPARQPHRLGRPNEGEP